MERRRKLELKELNARAWNGETEVFSVQSSLDSNMKKNTTFIKRLRTGITSTAIPTFMQEIRSLSLHKYLAEIVNACFEGLCKVKISGDVAAAVEIVSALHQRFGPDEFTCYLGWLVGRGLSTPDKSQLKALATDVREREEKERLARQRVLLRVATDLWLVGVLRSLDDVKRPEEAGKKDGGKILEAPAKSRSNNTEGPDPEPFPLEVLKDMLSHDREHVNLPLVVLFVKNFARDILGTRPANIVKRQNVAEDGTTSNFNAESAPTTDDEATGAQDEADLIAPELQKRFRNILTRYFEDVKAHLVRDQKHLSAQGKRNAEAYVKSGEVFEDRQANHEKASKAQEKLISNAQSLAEALGVDMPDLVEKDAAGGGSEGSIGLVKTGEYLRGQADGAGIWEDEDERRFYENLVDLKDRVPGILLEDGKKKKTDTGEQVGKKTDPSEATDKTEAKPADNEDASTAIANKTIGAQVDALLAHLPEATTKDQVDQLAIDFCFLNSKASRNRLLKAIEEIPKGRTDLLPLYARLIATLGKHLPDVPQGITTYLDDEFRSLQRRKSKDFLGQVRMVNVRYIAELTKFGVIPEHVIFHCLKVSLDDFSRMNIEIIATLLENCGRYLLRNPETSPRMASLLETLQRKKAAQHLGQQERMLLENAVYYVNPPERAAIQQKERTPLDLFVRKLVYLDLNKKTVEKITKQIRKLHWEEPEVIEVLRKIFVKPGRIKFSHIHFLAVMLGALYKFHVDFAISVIDEVLERITVGLEVNDFKYNQRRIAEVRYLGELYIYRMVDSTLIFDTLCKLLNYGHDGYAQPDKYTPIDLPDDFFRIRLVSALLETCGMYFEKGTLRKKLDFFLMYLQYYINTKEPLPMDVEFVVLDLFNLVRPQWKLVLHDFAEASKAFAEVCKDNYGSASNGGGPEAEAEPEDADEREAEMDGSDDEHADGDDANNETTVADGDREPRSDNDEPSASDDDKEREDESSDEEHIVVTRPEDQRDPEAEAEFDRELAKLMSESVESRKFDRKTMFDVPLPIRRTLREATNNTADDSGGETAAPAPAEDSSTMKFALLSKKGNRQQTRSIDLPSDSTFAVAMRNQQQAERAEQQRIKNLVLNYDLTDDQPDGEPSSFHYVISPRSKSVRLVGKGAFNQRPTHPSPALWRENDTRSQPSTVKAGPPLCATHAAAPFARLTAVQPSHALTDESGGNIDQLHGGPRYDKAGSSRSKQRARKLQLGDIDWYAGPQTPQATSLESYIVNKRAPRRLASRQSSRGDEQVNAHTTGKSEG